tara:strand:+ start:476 stop:1933 length:1458 start_codon:yes stop_codon:yes gene_type:complete
MAIPFLNNINLSDNQLLNAKLQITGTAPAAEQGQIYFNSAAGFLKPRVHDGSAWLDLLDTTSIINGTYITSTVTSNVDLTLDLSAVNGTATAATRFLSKDNTWAVPVDYGNWVASDNVTTETVTTGETVKWVGSGTTGVVLSGGTFTITSSDEFVGTVTSVAATHAGNAFTASIGNTATINPSVDITMNGAATDYIDGEGNLTAFPPIPQGDITDLIAGTYIQIDNAAGPSPTVNALGTATPYVAATDDSKLVARDANGYGYVKTPASGDSTTKIATTAFVQQAVTGLLEFKGGFDANTGLLNPATPSPAPQDLYADIPLEIGDYYVATVAGNFFGDSAYPLTPGDSVIATIARAAGAALVTDFAVVQSDTDLATLTTVGIGNVNAGAGVDVSYSGGTATVSLGAQSSLTFSNTGPATAGTSYPITAATHGLGSDSSLIMVQIVEVSTGATVYTDVVRGASGLITITFADSQAINTFRALLQKIG